MKTQSGSTDSSDKISKDTILKVAKEITVKFIEVGRVSPASFDATFASIYNTIKKTTDHA